MRITCQHGKLVCMLPPSPETHNIFYMQTCIFLNLGTQGTSTFNSHESEVVLSWESPPLPGSGQTVLIAFWVVGKGAWPASCLWSGGRSNGFTYILLCLCVDPESRIHFTFPFSNWFSITAYIPPPRAWGCGKQMCFVVHPHDRLQNGNNI